MKKLILSTVFVFAIGSFSQVDAKVGSSCYQYDNCYEFAEGVEELHGGGYEAFSAAYDHCESLEGNGIGNN